MYKYIVPIKIKCDQKPYSIDQLILIVKVTMPIPIIKNKKSACQKIDIRSFYLNKTVVNYRRPAFGRALHPVLFSKQQTVPALK